MLLKDYCKLSNDELEDIIAIEKKAHDTVILAHNYVRDEVQRVADFLGDSLELSRRAARVSEKTIVFCGVYFMAETAKILSPEKRVLIPDATAGCPLAASATMGDVLKLREQYPKHAFVAYVNTSAEVKAAVDLCCTSANALDIVKSLGDRPVVFLPDMNLGAYIKRQLAKENMVLWSGGCYVHQFITLEDMIRARKDYPRWTIIVHPECTPAVTETADVVASTGGMLHWVADHDNPVLLGTEIGMVERIKREMPEKKVEPLKNSAVCYNMKQLSLPKLARSVKEGIYEVTIESEILHSAFDSISKMISIG
ncbi:quinolinate synthase NadA [bacterium]|nr:quinolinate synthase NadA [bacterium]